MAKDIRKQNAKELRKAWKKFVKEQEHRVKQSKQTEMQ